MVSPPTTQRGEFCGSPSKRQRGASNTITTAVASFRNGNFARKCSLFAVYFVQKGESKDEGLIAKVLIVTVGPSSDDSPKELGAKVIVLDNFFPPFNGKSGKGSTAYVVNYSYGLQ